MKPPDMVRRVRFVVVSPGDVLAERSRLAMVVDELNRTLAPSRGCTVSLWRWETDAHPGLHLEGPQGLIDDAMEIADADAVIGVFWTRLGTPTGDSRSGTEHELRRAWSAWSDQGRPQVMVYFCERNSRPKDAEAAAQTQRLLSFREALPNRLLWWTYVKVADFERVVREHLTAFLIALENGPAPGSTQESEASRPPPSALQRRSVTAVNVAMKHYDPRTDSFRAKELVAAGSRLPLSVMSEAITVIDNQVELSVEFLQRSARLDKSSDVHLFEPLAHVRLRLGEGLRRGTPLRVTISIDAAGRLTAQAAHPPSDSAIGSFEPVIDRGAQAAAQVPIQYEGLP